MTKNTHRAALNYRIAYALQLEKHDGEIVRAPFTPIHEPRNLEILRRCGRNLCAQGRAESWAIIEIKIGRARNKVIETGCAHNDTWDLDELNGY